MENKLQSETVDFAQLMSDVELGETYASPLVLPIPSIIWNNVIHKTGST